MRIPLFKPLAPLGETLFRRVWSASVLSNLGQLILGVGAAWEMTRLTDSPAMVALVQTALMLPLMLASVPAGALADMFDRRKVAIAGLVVAGVFATLHAVLAYSGLLSPWTILAFCFLIGSGVSLYSPAWQASISEQVSPDNLPAAIALGSISYNLARSFGPALGGLIVLAFGAQAAFAVNAIFYLPLLFAFLLWRRQAIIPRLPPEGVGRAMVSGARYVSHSPLLRKIVVRCAAFGFAGATAAALAPLIARDMLNGDASTYGVLLGASGAGAVVGALMVSWARSRWKTDIVTSAMMLVTAAALMIAATSQNLFLTCVAMFAIGTANMLVIALYNVTVQLAAPRWVLARALSLFGASMTGGIAVGAWAWGVLANETSVTTAVVASGVMMAILPLISWLLPIEEKSNDTAETVSIGFEPDIALPITLRSGPVVIEIDYRVDPDDAREFYDAALKLRPLRLRNGGYDWSLSRDIADPGLWTERYSCPTWADYLRIRDRHTAADVAGQQDVSVFLVKDCPPIVRRKLDRPFGSVRWKHDSVDPKKDRQMTIAP
ncbi:MFS transporter [Pontixanthobacter aquaemixtae]|uniref:MFS transporter n=1 Tax=Pontixanthobacter aquaemixtae TaxID=1958940 RepID=A0A844ZQG1_9SPHN|nr:MFS transporter [Pontixanthobacter aquaemixtae]MXO89988.1 MFS transporter [Pontixanthobacter aquaemixtae]